MALGPQLLTIDPSGLWSPVKARKVIEILNPQAKAFGIEFVAIDVTTFDMPHRRVLLSAHCIEHQYPVPVDSVCEMCRRYCRE